jgi:hypothetical protein
LHGNFALLLLVPLFLLSLQLLHVGLSDGAQRMHAATGQTVCVPLVCQILPVVKMSFVCVFGTTCNNRLGQTRAVTVHRLVTRGTVDRNILDIAGRKLRLDAQIMDGVTLVAQQVRTFLCDCVAMAVWWLACICDGGGYGLACA